MYRVPAGKLTCLYWLNIPGVGKADAACQESDGLGRYTGKNKKKLLPTRQGKKQRGKFPGLVNG
jgi:hypothetical protein